MPHEYALRVKITHTVSSLGFRSKVILFVSRGLRRTRRGSDGQQVDIPVPLHIVSFARRMEQWGDAGG